MPALDFQINNVVGREVSARTFNSAIQHALYLLTEFDAGISQKRRGSLAWYIARLGSDSSQLTVSFISHLKPTKQKRQIPPDIAPRVTTSFLSGVEDIEERCKTPPYLSELGMERAGELSDLLSRNGAAAFRFSSEDRAVEITPKTSENVHKLLPTKRTAIGSVEGRLEGINMHKHFRGVLYHAITHKAITCLFDETQFDLVKNALGQHVVVFGELQKNINGDTVRIARPSLEIIEGRNRFRLPDVGELGKPDFEDIDSTKEYMELIRG